MKIKLTLSNGMTAETSSQRRYVLFRAFDSVTIVRRSDDLATVRKLRRGNNDFIVDTVQGREIR
jgi:hypothetical protein